jgi:hypothetical protein
MPNVYCYFDGSEHAPTNQAKLLRLWVRSWRARGWTPRILTIQNAARHKQFDTLGHDFREWPRLAMEAEGIKWLSDIHAINFSFTPREFRKSGAPRAQHFHSAGWENAPVILFENVQDPEVIEQCGRPL